MTRHPAAPDAAVAGLQALLSATALPTRGRRRCEALLARLQAPVRLALFGVPGAGKRHVANALAGDAVLPGEGPLPPVLIAAAPFPRAVLIHEDGCSRTLEAHPELAALPASVIYAELGLPLPALRQMSLLFVAIENAGDLHAALRWAASRCDIAVWVSAEWSAEEQAIWDKAPETLKNHAVLVSGAGQGARGFEHGACRIAAPGDPAGLSPTEAEALRAHLDRVIACARAEDRAAADMVLAQYADLVTAWPDAAVRPPGAAVPGAPTATGSPPPAMPAREHTIEDRAAVMRLFLHLRQNARDLIETLPDPASGPLSETDARDFLVRCEEAMADLTDLAEGPLALADRCPAVDATLRDASELMLLLRMEGGVAQAAEAVALLAQVRRDVELRLAA